MVQPIEITILALNLIMSVVLFQVGRVVLERRPSGAGHLAASAFAGWWFALSFLQLGSILDFAVRSTIGWTLASYMAYFQLVLLAIVLALGALMYYLFYLYTGLRGSWKALAVLYGAYYLTILYWLALAQPEALDQSGVATTLEYANDLSDTLFTQLLGILLLAPPFLGAIGYFTLFFRVPERSQKFRIATIAGSFIVWFGISLGVGQFTDWDGTTAWRVVSSLITLGAAYMVYSAFRPPNWMRRRFRLTGYGEH